MNQMIVLGLTGGIGSGKSTVAKIFAAKSIPIYTADDAAKQLYTTDPQLKEQVLHTFGADSYINGELNRAYLSEIVFNSKERLAQLNALVHPAVARDFAQWKNQHQQAKLVIKEAAILFESGSAQTCDCTLTVNCAEAIRIERVMKRDQVALEAVKARINQQWTDEQRTKKADYSIVNDGSQLVLPQVESTLKLIEERFFDSMQNH